MMVKCLTLGLNVTNKTKVKNQFLLIQASWPWGVETVFGEKLKDIKKKRRTDDCMLFRIKDNSIVRCDFNGRAFS